MQQVFKEGMQHYNNTGMSELIMNRAKQYDWDKSAIKYIEVYDSLM